MTVGGVDRDDVYHFGWYNYAFFTVGEYASMIDLRMGSITRLFPPIQD